MKLMFKTEEQLLKMILLKILKQFKIFQLQMRQQF